MTRQFYFWIIFQLSWEKSEHFPAKRGKANSTSSFRAKKILAQSCEEHLLGLAAPACHVELHLVYVKPLEVQKRGTLYVESFHEQ